MWLQICQGLLLLGFVVRLCLRVIYAATGRPKEESSGALGIFLTIVWFALAGVVLVRAGGLSTIVGYP